jgi:hypothetical protein
LKALEKLAGLMPSTLYHYRVLSRDAGGNPAVSSDYTFTLEAETTPPSIYDTFASPSSPSQDEGIEISSTVTDDSGVAGVVLWYTVDDVTWNKISMARESGDTYKTTTWIPGQVFVFIFDHLDDFFGRNNGGINE